jgi:hypothetical protein
MSQFLSSDGRVGPGWALLGGLALLAVVVSFVAPSWTCAPFRLGDLIEPGELPVPLPPNCAPTADGPSADTMRSLDAQREEMGLALQETITCKVAASPGSRANPLNSQWTRQMYVGGVLRYKRHVLIAATQDAPGGTLFTVERSLMPWWKYVDQSGTDCWAQIEFWK